MTSRRFARPSQVWIRFQVALAEKVQLTIRRAEPPTRAPRCGIQPSDCVLTGRLERQAQEGFNQVALRRLLGGALTPGRYWLQVSSSSGRAHAGLAFRVMPPRDRQQRSRIGSGLCHRPCKLILDYPVHVG
jgi:hypothetical protein